ncbi:MAG: hypothetical protein OEY33_08070 [Bdellovibrionales bacterium]|nr:hypothetical protein [Bdellovibrionales bacterium]
MNPKNKRWKGGPVLTQRDIKIFEFLFEYKCATEEQIRKKFFQNCTYQACYVRLSKLIERAFIGKKAFIFNNQAKSYFYLKDNGLVLLERNYSLKFIKKELESDSPAHDIGFLDIAENLKEYSMVDRLITENLFQSNEELLFSDELSPFSRLNPDAIVKINIESCDYLVALEYELSPKWKVRYQKKFLDYYLESGIQGVFYICQNEKLKSRLAKIDQEFWNNFDSKIFFCLSEDVFFPSGKVTFSNLNGDNFYLN